MPTLVERTETVATQVSCGDDALVVVLDDGRTVSVPLAWFPTLFNATGKQRQDWVLIGGDVGIHWDAIDEDISVASLLQPERFLRMVTRTSRRKRSAARRGFVFCQESAPLDAAERRNLGWRVAVYATPRNGCSKPASKRGRQYQQAAC